MISLLAAYGFVIICLATVSAMFAILLAGVYWRSGPVAGLATLGALGLAGTMALSGDFTIPIVALAALLIQAVESRWSLSRTIWQGFAVNSLIVGAWMAMVVVALESQPLAVAELEAMLAKLEVSDWVIAATPGFLIAGQFLAAWLGAVFASNGREDLWPRRQVQDWQIPWYLVWVLIVCGFGAVCIFEGLIRDREDGLLRMLFTSGAVVAGSWFLVQGILVGMVAIQTWNLPLWLGLLMILSIWHFLPLLGVAEIWAGFRPRLRAAAEARAKARQDRGSGPGPG